MRLRGLPIAAALICTIVIQARADDRTTCERSSGDPAIAACTRAIESGTYAGLDLAKLHNNRGVERKLKGDLDGAIADYGVALALNPGDFFAYNNRANVRRDKGDLAGAIADYGEAVRIEPDYAAAYINRALVHERMGNVEAARADFNAALKASPTKFRNSPGAQQIARERLRALTK